MASRPAPLWRRVLIWVFLATVFLGLYTLYLGGFVRSALSQEIELGVLIVGGALGVALACSPALER